MDEGVSVTLMSSGGMTRVHMLPPLHCGGVIPTSWIFDLICQEPYALLPYPPMKACQRKDLAETLFHAKMPWDQIRVERGGVRRKRTPNGTDGRLLGYIRNEGPPGHRHQLLNVIELIIYPEMHPQHEKVHDLSPTVYIYI